MVDVDKGGAELETPAENAYLASNLGKFSSEYNKSDYPSEPDTRKGVVTEISMLYKFNISEVDSEEGLPKFKNYKDEVRDYLNGKLSPPQEKRRFKVAVIDKLIHENPEVISTLKAGDLSDVISVHTTLEEKLLKDNRG